jgi:hypothetical protein
MPPPECDEQKASTSFIPSQEVALRLEDGCIADIDDVFGPYSAIGAYSINLSTLSDATAFMDAPLCKRPITQKVKKRSLAKRIKNFTKRLNKFPTFAML